MSSTAPLRVRFRVAAALHPFLKPALRSSEFEHSVGSTDTVKHSVESLGIPHTEVGEFIVNGVTVAPGAPLLSGDVVDVLPPREPVVLEDAVFVVDGHLGRLTAHLRMLGFDCWYKTTADDEELAGVARTEDRVLLTRDVGLLKRREVQRGYCVRADKPRDQLHEVVRRFGLQQRISPFQRCMECNGTLETVSKVEVDALLPPHTRETKDVFSRCTKCAKVFWRGSHYQRMLGLIDECRR